MGSYTNSFANHSLDDVVGTAPYLSLHTASPTDTGDATDEVATGSGYARQSTTGTWETAGATTDREKSTNGDISFSEATGTWGTISHMALCASGNEGTADLKLYGSLSSSKVIESGDQIVFKSGNITLSIASG